MPHIVLVGMMGAGKTTVGAALARRRGWEFVDSDAQVEARAGRTVAEIWATDGEAAFRVLESAALAEALADEPPAVIAAAGGTVLDPANWEMLRAHRPVVWLRADPATLADRLGHGEGRPLLAGDAAGSPQAPPPAQAPPSAQRAAQAPLSAQRAARALKQLVAEREPIYAEVADIVVHVDGLESAEVVEAVEVALRDENAGSR